MPTVVSGNTQRRLHMIGEKCVDLLLAARSRTESSKKNHVRGLPTHPAPSPALANVAACLGIGEF